MFSHAINEYIREMWHEGPVRSCFFFIPSYSLMEMLYESRRTATPVKVAR